ncbi:MAG: hypothetical protein COB02_11140 [Candidatus Cloacimonadota bacterium]|nr:MAG: hypothetical protein COB02_11140 [Candidatus Cloacimonadota bacterium]
MRVFLTALLFVSLVSSAYSAMTITGLGNNTRCTASAFGHSDGQTQVANAGGTPGLPAQSPALKLQTPSVVKNSTSAVISFKGVYAEFDSATLDERTSGGVAGPLINGRAFYNIYKCDEAATSSPIWAKVFGDSTASQVILTSGVDNTISFTDSGLSNPTSKLNYLIVALTNSDYRFNSTDNDFDLFINGTALAKKTFAQAYTDADTKFTGSTDETFRTWSNALAVVADFRGSGFALTAPSATAFEVDVNGAVNQTFSVTTTAEVVSSPTYAFTLDKSLPAGLTGTTGTGVDAGKFVITGVATEVGATTITLTAALTATGFTGEVQQSTFDVIVKPQAITITNTANLGQQERNTTQIFTLVSANGLSASNTVLATPSFSLKSSDLVAGNGTVTVSGNILTITLNDVNAEFVGTSISIVVDVADVAKAGQTVDSKILTTGSTTFALVVKDHEFNFAQSVLTDANTYSTKQDVTRYIELKQLTSSADGDDLYTVSTVNDATPDTVTIVSGTLNGVSFTTAQVTTQLAGVGLKWTDGTNGSGLLEVDSATIFKLSKSLGSQVVLVLNATNAGSVPSPSITTTVGFIISDRVVPTVQASAWSVFNWGVADKTNFLPILSSTHTLNVTFSKQMETAPTVKVVVGANEFSAITGAITGTNKNEVTYTYDFSAHSALVAPTVSVNSLDISWRVETDGKDLQPVGLELLFNNNTANTASGVKIVNPLGFVSSNGTLTFKANDSLMISLNKVVTNPEIVNDSTAILSTIGNAFSASFSGTTSSVLKMTPVTHWDYTKSDVTLVGSKFLDADGLPMLSNGVPANTIVAVTIEGDTFAPIVKDISVVSSSAGTSVTYVVTFDELIGSAVTTTKNGTTVINGVTTTGNGSVVTIVANGLPFNSKIDFSLDAKDGSNNTVVVPLQIATIAQEDVAKIIVETTDTEKPFIVSITPDVRDSVVADQVAVRPLFIIGFNETVDSSGATIVLTDMVAASIAGSVVDRFIKGLQFATTTQLKSGTSYKLTISGVKDSSNNVMDNYVVWFKTIAASVTAAAPSFKGAGFVGRKVSLDQALVFYFNETLDAGSLVNGFSLKKGVNDVNGSWSINGNLHTFSPSIKLDAESTYAYSFTTGVSGLLANKLSAEVTGTFDTKVAQAIEGFSVVVKPTTGSTYTASVEFSPVADETSIVNYEFRSVISSTLTFGSRPSAASHTVATSVVGLKRTTAFTVTGLTANQNVKFWVEAISSDASRIGTAVASVYGVVANAADIVDKFVAANQTKITTIAIGAVGAEDATLLVDPSVLKTSTALTVSKIDGNTKAAMDKAVGGGGKIIAPVQFGPDGLEFNAPLEFALRFNYASFANASSLTEKDLFNLVNVLTFSPDSNKWVSDGVAKTRVVTSAGQFAQIFAKTSHFSVFTVGEALNFTTTNTTLIKDGGVYTISWNAGLEASNVLVTVKDDNGTDISASTYTLTKNATNLTLSGLFQQNTNVLVTLTGDTSSPAPKTFVIPTEIIITNDAQPTLVKGINVTQSVLTTQATVSWSAITGTSTTIRDILITYSQDSSFPSSSTTLAVGIGDTSVVVNGLVAGKTYWWKVQSRNLQITPIEKRLSAASFTDVTFGKKTETLGRATLTLDAGVTWSELTTTTLFTAKIVNSNGTIAGPNGQTPIVAGGLFEFDFPTSALHKSVKFSVNDTSSNLGLYHYSATKIGWEVVTSDTTKDMFFIKAKGGVDPSNNAGQSLCNFNVAANQTCIKLSSKGEGSPFAAVNVPAVPVVIRSGGGGGCSLTAGDDGIAGWINFFLIFLPLGLLYIRRK